MLLSAFRTVLSIWRRTCSAITLTAVPSSAAAAGVFQRLQTAGRRLLGIIEKNRDGTNKDLARFADQITALCDKWDR